MVRLQLEGLKPTKKGQTIFDTLNQAKKSTAPRQKKKLDPDDPNFDSEEEYGNEAQSYHSDSEGSEEGEQEISENEPRVNYQVKKIPPNEYLIKREATLIAILKRSFKKRVIIFCNEKLQCTRLLALLTMYGFRAQECHGNMDQQQRLQAVENF